MRTAGLIVLPGSRATRRSDLPQDDRERSFMTQ